MNAFGLPKQDIMTFDLLVGTDGKKMSKTSPNCILIDDTPFDMYQKLINVDDSLIVHYFTFATDMTVEQVDMIAKRLASGEHPNILKKELADYVVTMYHGKPYDPSDLSTIEEIRLSQLALDLEKNEILISLLLKGIGFCSTSGDVRNAIS